MAHSISSSGSEGLHRGLWVVAVGDGVGVLWPVGWPVGFGWLLLQFPFGTHLKSEERFQNMLGIIFNILYKPVSA